MVGDGIPSCQTLFCGEKQEQKNWPLFEELAKVDGIMEVGCQMMLVHTLPSRAPDWLGAGSCASKFELIACLEGVPVKCVGCVCHVPPLHGFPRFTLRYHGPDRRDKSKRQGHSHG